MFAPISVGHALHKWTTGTNPTFCVVLGCLLNLSIVTQSIAQSDDIDSLKMVMRSDICPGNPARTTRPAQHEQCGGDGTHNPCGYGLNYDRVCGENYLACAKQWREDNEVRNKYNKWIETHCKAKVRGKSGSQKTGTSTPASEISKRLEAARKKAANYQVTTQEYQQKLLQDERAAVERAAISRRDQEIREERRQYEEARRLALHRAQI